MLNFEITHRGYSFPVTMLDNGKKIVDFYSADVRFLDDEFDAVKEEVKTILGMAV
jgi:hypothetical protein